MKDSAFRFSKPGPMQMSISTSFVIYSNISVLKSVSGEVTICSGGVEFANLSIYRAKAARLKFIRYDKCAGSFCDTALRVGVVRDA